MTWLRRGITTVFRKYFPFFAPKDGPRPSFDGPYPGPGEVGPGQVQQHAAKQQAGGNA